MDRVSLILTVLAIALIVYLTVGGIVYLAVDRYFAKKELMYMNLLTPFLKSPFANKEEKK